MLHSARFDGLGSHAQAAGEDTAKLLTRDFRTHAAARGLPSDLIENLHVHYDHETGSVHAGTRSADHKEALDEYEYGTGTRAPMGVVSTFMSAHSERATEYFTAAMLHRSVGS